MKELKLAYEELEFDGCFPDLLKYLGKRIIEFDPKFANKLNGDVKLSAEEQKAVDDDLMDFLGNIND